ATGARRRHGERQRASERAAADDDAGTRRHAAGDASRRPGRRSRPDLVEAERRGVERRSRLGDGRCGEPGRPRDCRRAVAPRPGGHHPQSARVRTERPPLQGAPTARNWRADRRETEVDHEHLCRWRAMAQLGALSPQPSQSRVGVSIHAIRHGEVVRHSRVDSAERRYRLADVANRRRSDAGIHRRSAPARRIVQSARSLSGRGRNGVRLFHRARAARLLAGPESGNAGRPVLLRLAVHLRGGSGTVESRRAETPCSGGTRWRGCIDASPSDGSLRAIFNFQPPTSNSQAAVPGVESWGLGSWKLEVWKLTNPSTPDPFNPPTPRAWLLGSWKLEVW